MKIYDKKAIMIFTDATHYWNTDDCPCYTKGQAGNTRIDARKMLNIF